MLATCLFVATFSLPGHAQSVTNLTSGAAPYADLATAVAQASAGDELEIDGTLTSGATIDRDLRLIGAAGGAEISAQDGPVLTLAQLVELEIVGVDLQASGPWRVIVAIEGGNVLNIQDAELRAGGVKVGSRGGLIEVTDSFGMELTDVVLRGTAGVDLADEGGAVAIDGTGPLTLADVTFTDVSAEGNGGAIWSFGMPVTCLRCLFNHTHGAFGGAIFAGGADLTIRDSRFCATSGSLGGAIFASSDTNIRASLFTETEASTNGGAIYANAGNWRIQNNTFLGVEVGAVHDDAATVASYGNQLEVRNSLFVSSSARALDVLGTTLPAQLTYNWFTDNLDEADVALDATNTTGTDPQLVRWTPDQDCSDDQPWPIAIVSPLIDAGDPALFDPDGSVSDIGAFGGPDAGGVPWLDGDGDGLRYLEDCDDTDATILGEQPFWPDCDADGQGQPTGAVVSCFAPTITPIGCDPAIAGWTSGLLGNADCDDTDPLVYPGAPELCDAIDQNCDGDAYAGAVDATAWFLDLDGDGFGDRAFSDCGGRVPGWVMQGGDCNDNDDTVYPDAPDECGDGIDQDCSGTDGTPNAVVDWYPDADGDGFGDPTQPPLEACVPGSLSGYAPNAEDCDDTDASIRPSAPEICDGRDNDCNGTIDDAVGSRTWFADIDGDGIGTEEVSVDGRCAPEGSWALIAGDCNDDNPSVATCGCGGCASLAATPVAGWVTVLGLLAVLGRRRSPALLVAWGLGSTASAQTLDNGDLEAAYTPGEVPNAAPISVPGWRFGDGADPLVEAQVAAVGAPVYCVDVLTKESPSNLDSGGLFRHFAHAEALNALPAFETNEWLSTTVRDLDPNAAYRVRFEVSMVRHLGQQPGFWRVSFGPDTLDAPVVVRAKENPGQQDWWVQTLDPFVVGSAEAELRFEAVAVNTANPTDTPPNDCDVEAIDGLTQLLIDGIRIIPDSDGDGIFDDEDPCPERGAPDDHDLDGLLDALETPEGYGTDPCNPDTDQDGLTDGEEIALAAEGNGICPDPNQTSSDDDDLSDGEEYAPDPPIVIELLNCPDATTTSVAREVVSDPCTDHSDLDGLPDDYERHTLGTDPSMEDTDGDGIWDHEDPDPLDCAPSWDATDPTITTEELKEGCDAGCDSCCKEYLWRARSGSCGCATPASAWSLIGPTLIVLGALARRRLLLIGAGP
ncbi:MAG: MopE-related protein [Myxococcota bacterium]